MRDDGTVEEYIREEPLDREVPKELVDYVENVLNIQDANMQSVYGVDYLRQVYHEAAVKPYGLAERDTWMLFATMEHDLRHCGRDVNRLVNLYHKALCKCKRHKGRCVREVNGVPTEFKVYDWGKYTLREIMSGKDATGRKLT